MTASLVGVVREGMLLALLLAAPLLVAAEGGIPAGVLTTALLLAAGWRAYVGGRAGLALYGAYLPFVVLDHFPYSVPLGLIVTGIWLGVIELLARDREEELSRLPEARASGRRTPPA